MSASVDPLGLHALLRRLADVPTAAFTAASPFPHLMLDNAIDARGVDDLHATVGGLPHDRWDKSNDAGVEVKWRSNWQSEYDIPEPAREIVRFFNSGLVLREFSRLTGIPHLIADPYYTGGGFNLLRKGGYLDVHVDGNWHDAMGVHRRLST